MLEKTFSFWRRLVGAEPVAAPESALQDDRRLWVRFAADLQGNLHLAQDKDADSILAKVRDLSVGGANLLVDRAVRLGQMVTLELPSDREEVYSVLACVVRVHAHADGTWSLGCVFSRELSPEDLQRVGAEKQAADASDLRTWVRFTCKLQASYRKVGAATVGEAPNSAQILNISANGIGLAVQPALHAGTLLNVDLLDMHGNTVRTLLACIVHTTRRAGGDFALGCNFIRVLSEEELQSLLSA